MTKKNSSKIGLVLLHNNLRIHDNSTLLKASVTCDNLLIVYCKKPLFQPTLNRGQAFHNGNFEKMGQAREVFLHQTLTELNSSLQALGNGLLYLDAEKESVNTFQLLKQLINQHDVEHIFVSETADYDQTQGYRLLADSLPKVNWYYTTTVTLFDTLPTDGLPEIFSQFRKKIEYSHNLLTADSDLLISPTPTSLPAMPKLSNEWSEKLKYCSNINTNDSSNRKNDSKNNVSTPFIGGEIHALEHLNTYFSSNHPKTYKETRNALNLTESWSDTTRFSPWLANGSLSVRVILNRLRAYECEQGANDSTYWIWFELLWREYFYWYANKHGKRLFWFSGIANNNVNDNANKSSSKKTEINKKLKSPSKVNVRPCSSFYGERFERWKQGNTPYAIVNACMKQLNATGYMSNRGRQLVASCFIHEMGMDWRYGASYFEQQLIDYDVGSNWGNWQYLAGVGADPRGCRRFNLTKQTQQHDPKGEFINKWQGNSGDMQMDSVDMVDWYI